MIAYFSRSLVGAVALGAAVAVAGCGGSQLQSTPQTISQAPVVPQVKDHCPAHGGVRATPCSVDFTVSSPGPDTVTVRTPERKKGTLVEQNNCGGASGIATVTQGSGDTWIVTAGATAGSCTATFNFESGKKGKVVGHADVAITNAL